MIIRAKCFQLNDDSLASTDFIHTLIVNKIKVEKHLITTTGLLTVNNKSKVIIKSRLNWGWKLALISMLTAFCFKDDSLPLFL